LPRSGEGCRGVRPGSQRKKSGIMRVEGLKTLSRPLRFHAQSRRVALVGAPVFSSQPKVLYTMVGPFPGSFSIWMVPLVNCGYLLAVFLVGSVDPLVHGVVLAFRMSAVPMERTVRARSRVNHALGIAVKLLSWLFCMPVTAE
jgi:hypothetical protein